MRLGWDEIKQRALLFTKKWTNAKVKHCAQITDDFFGVFGISPWKVDTFDKVELKNKGKNYSLLCWKGVAVISALLPDLGLTEEKNKIDGYVKSLPPQERPTHAIICNFDSFTIYGLNKDVKIISISDFYKQVGEFAFLIGYITTETEEKNPSSLICAEKTSEFCDKLIAKGYSGRHLEILIVRLIFCMFSDNSSIFDKNSFYEYLLEGDENATDLSSRLSLLFKRLAGKSDKPENFPCILGGIFDEEITLPNFTQDDRLALLQLTKLDWANISPEIFGAMIQCIMDKKERRSLGAYYTSEANILKTLKPLFIDGLLKQLDECNTTAELKAFHEKIANLKFLDPACGCGNFLVVAYRELREIELKLVEKLYSGQQVFDISQLFKVKTDNFYGIELKEFPAMIARCAMWLMDHRINMRASEIYGTYFTRLPMVGGANIEVGNALTCDWNSVCGGVADYVFSNPPFVGAKLMSAEQRKDVQSLCPTLKGIGTLDYVCGWFIKSAEYLKGTNGECALVATNSITQGEQVTILWKYLIAALGMRINFAHRTFKWNTDMGSAASVFCVIVGFGANGKREKVIFDYENVNGEPIEKKVFRINPYLVDARTVFIESRNTPVCKVLPMTKGCQPTDGGNLILTTQEKDELISKEPAASKYIKKLLGADEFLNNKERWCLWLVDATDEQIAAMPLVAERVDAVREFRLNSTFDGTVKLADTPKLFRETYNYSSYVVMPSVSTERRIYIPLGFLGSDTICTNANLIIPFARLYDFGILSSKMHMAWTSYVCGRLKSDYRYSAKIVYNNFIWPNCSEEGKKEITDLAQAILNVRAKYPHRSLSSLYDPMEMPDNLLTAHEKLDKAVDKLYGKYFSNDAERVAYLFERYTEICGGGQLSIDDVD